MEIRHEYRDNKELRDSFNELAGKVFGLNFEGWYQNGYWKNAYDPYSVIADGKVVYITSSWPESKFFSIVFLMLFPD